MQNLIKYLSVPLLLIVGCKVPQASSLPPQNTTDIVIIEEVDDAATTPNYLDEWFIAATPEDDPYPSVCSLHTESGYLIGSGILIRPGVVLTAGHCVNGNNVFSITIGNEQIMVKKTVLHSRYSDSLGRLHNDIALIFLECESKYEPAELGCIEWIKRYQSITTVGYSFEYKKYSKPKVFRYFGTVTEEPDTMKFIPRPASVWFGDSGGGVFAEYEGKSYLVGVISNFMVIKPFSGKPVVSECSATIVSLYLEWIEREVLKNEIEETEIFVRDGR